MKPPERIETKRLLLRMPKLEDAEALFEEYVKDRSVTRYLVWRPHEDIEETRGFLESRVKGWREGADYTWVITKKPTDRAIGMIGITVKGFKAEIGFVLARAYWNRGYMTEAIRAVVDWAVEQPEIYRVWAVCDMENPTSGRVLEKAGMVREGVLRRYIIHPNVSDEPRDCICYAKVK